VQHVLHAGDAGSAVPQPQDAVVNPVTRCAGSAQERPPGVRADLAVCEEMVPPLERPHGMTRAAAENAVGRDVQQTLQPPDERAVVADAQHLVRHS
jgi:hypothetical protein